MFRRLLLALSLSLCTGTQICRADQNTYLRDQDYNEGKLGRFVQQQFKTSELEPPAVNFMAPFSGCDDGSYFFVSPRGNVLDATFYILDHEGSLVWGPDHHYGEVYNFQVQTYKGEPVLIFWAGDDSIGGHGEGEYFMLNKHYEEMKVISAGDGIRADLHAFTITEDNHAIFTGYQVVPYDLTEVGRPRDSWIWESMFQEIDIETGEVTFEWRASDQFPFLDAYVNPNKATEAEPWDFFHINMVEKDTHGNFLVSTRYGRCVLYIDGRTKEILWRLGGKRNSFKDLSGGSATTFLGQHDAHWYKGHEYITMFDNRADWFHKIEEQSKGHIIKVDLERMTAELVTSYVHPEGILSTSQGSMQVLPNEHVLVGYGFNGAWTEFTFDGEPLCNAYIEPSKHFGSGDVQSYRNLKFNWTGIPSTTPSIARENEILYVSWLGSTETRTWLLQDCETANGLFESVQAMPKKGFETEFNMRSGRGIRQYVRAIAVDKGGTQLSISPPIDVGDPKKIWDSSSEQEQHEHEQEHNLRDDIEDAHILLILGILVIISPVLITFVNFGCRMRDFRQLRTEEGSITSSRDDASILTEGLTGREYSPGTSLTGRDSVDSIEDAGDSS